MNDTVRQLYERKSVRVYTDDPIDESIVQEILYSAAMAPTANRVNRRDPTIRARRLCRVLAE